MKLREVWVTRHPESIDVDHLTHIALFKYYSHKNPMHFREVSPELEAAYAECEKAFESFLAEYKRPDLMFPEIHKALAALRKARGK